MKLFNSIIAALIVPFGFVPECLANDWLRFTNDEIANAVYRAEGGKKAKVPYGILSVRVKDEADARRVCIRTIQNNRARFAKQTKYDDFIEFLGSKYCPVSEHKLNRFWVKNVKSILGKEK